MAQELRLPSLYFLLEKHVGHEPMGILLEKHVGHEPIRILLEIWYFHILHQEHMRTGATRVRACNYVKIETGRNFPPILKIVTRTAQAA